MASEQKGKFVIHVMAIILVLKMFSLGVNGDPQVPCYFIFGDSLVDNGNNNRIASLARANYLPYGIDFPNGPTGRFSNGLTVVDVVAELLGFNDYIPPYANARGRIILNGVNYASAAAGIRDETGQQLGARISFGGQVNNYKNTVSQVVDILGDEDSAASYLRQCIYSVGLGSNDYLNNYFMPNYYQTSNQYTPEQYAGVLIQQYSELIRELYNYGARKLVLNGIGQIGCSPNALSNSQDGTTCVEKINTANRCRLYVIMNGGTFYFAITFATFIAMASEQNGKFVIHVMATILVLKMFSFGVNGDPQVPCYFIFGDSLVDNGNNNRIASLARANYLPYGIDFPRGPTGRFSNGLTVVDVVAELLGFNDYIPPYANARGRIILNGVNYASAAAGIRDETGQQLGARISFGGQVNNYKNTVSQVVDILGDEDSAASYLRQCIYSVGLGSNDYLNNYFMPNYYQTSNQYTPEQYAGVLIQQYSELIRELYNYGARKLVLNGIGQIGCSPNALSNSEDGSTCVEKINTANKLFNNLLRSLVDNLNRELTDAKFIYINNYDIFQDLINSPQSYGFTVTNAGCCGVGRNNGQITCLPGQTPCQNRDEHIFWDAFHPSEAANVIVGRRSYSAQSSSDAYPMDIRQLAQL
ncbi:Lipase, GDSL [Artemisia annua]|uniref:Lipase, GDSL n=1 Tax=Artemisia annua TaxID=35608 RepID=A0A2U1LGQ0_ARTAN|nr:Lipase, GDSL [Artemisia annua]